VKYEKVYLNAYDNGIELWQDLNAYFIHYNHHRPHQALGYKTPAEVHFNKS
jgi:putative transposase